MNGNIVNSPYPAEIEKFLTGKAGTSLIIKGTPGAGKTTLALQILERLSKRYKIIYFSTRVGDESLYQQFPWLRALEKNIKLLISSKLFLEQITKNIKNEEKPVKEYGKRLLKEMTGEGEPQVYRSMFNYYFKDASVPEIKRLYDDIEMNLPKKTIIVVDSIEGITSKYNMQEQNFVYMLQKDLVEGAQVSIIFVSEKDGIGPEDYVADGVIYERHTVEDGRRIRIITLNKLRGIEIGQSSFAYTLEGGRFRVFYPENYYFESKNFEMSKNVGNKYKIGIPELDNILNGGIVPGSFFTIEIDRYVSQEEIILFFRPLFLNFIMNNIGIMEIPAGGWSVEKLKQDLVRFIPEEMFENGIRYIDYLAQESKKKYHVPAGGSNYDEINQRIFTAMLELSGIQNKPIMHFIGMDTLEFIKGTENAIKEIFNMSQAIKSSNDVGISMVRTGQILTDEIINISDYYIRLTSINNVPFIYGIKPRTIYYAVEVDQEKGFPNVKLSPMV